MAELNKSTSLNNENIPPVNGENGGGNSSEMGEIADSREGLDANQEIRFIYDVPLTIAAELGQLEMTIRELLSLNINAVIELEKLAGEPLEILINGKKVCRGEVIVINEHYGIRMTDLIDPKENTDIKSKTSQG